MNEKKTTHIQVKITAKDKLIAIRDKEGYASIEVVVDKLIAKLGSKSL